MEALEQPRQDVEFATVLCSIAIIRIIVWKKSVKTSVQRFLYRHKQNAIQLEPVSVAQ